MAIINLIIIFAILYVIILVFMTVMLYTIITAARIIDVIIKLALFPFVHLLKNI